MKNRLKKHSLFLAVLLLLTGCGHVKSAKKLIRTARAEHGACTVLSKSESAERVEVKLLDKKQGFEYTVKSFMSDLSIDGSSFGSYPQTRDGFEEALIGYVLSQSEAQLEALLNESGSSFDPDYLTVTAGPEADPEKVGEAVAALLQKQNVDHRMDNMDVEVQSSDGEHLGSCPFPECKFLNKEEEKDAFFLTQANEKMNAVVKKNRSITFVRKEEGTFADTNLPLSRAMETYGGGKITKQEDPVTFYYYKTKSQEFYIADFLDTDTGNWYTSFDLSLEKQKKGFFHVNVNIGSD